MRKVNKKILVIALSLMLVACAFVTILSFSMAADGDNGGAAPTVDAKPAFDVVTYTNIDRIIEKSHESGDDHYFRIVEVTSGAASAMGDTAKSFPVFQNLVIDGYKTIEQKMADNSIDYKAFSTTGMDTQACIDALSVADLIYLHVDPNNYYGQSDNGIPELVKIQLGSLATANQPVPFIVDGPIASQDDDIPTSTFYNNLITDVFNKYSGFAYSWDTSASFTAKQFFNKEAAGQSLYTKLSGKMRNPEWTKTYILSDYDPANPPKDKDGNPVGTPSDASKSYYYVNGSAKLAKVLVINADGSETGAISDKTKEGLTASTAKLFLEADIASGDGSIPKFVENNAETNAKQYNGSKTVYKLTDTADLYPAYVARETHPTYVEYDYKAYNDSSLPTTQFGSYDYIIIEDGAKGKAINNDVYNQLRALFLSGASNSGRIIYAKSLINTSSSSGVTKLTTKYDANFEYVCNKVMTSTEEPIAKNILVTTPSRMAGYMSANDKVLVKDIADIINNASYRRIGGGDGDSSNIFTVLEIEPSYPIDRKLAALFANIAGSKHIKDFEDPLALHRTAGTMSFAEETGRVRPLDGGQAEGGPAYMNTSNSSWYYLRNKGVINGLTSDEISYDGSKALTSFLEDGDIITSDNIGAVTDYYAWKVSKAKIAHLTGLSMDQVNVVHMSSYEFNCTKKTVLDNFDAVYIGGDNSGIKSIDAFNRNKMASVYDKSYNMYFIYGDAYDYKENYGRADGSVGALLGNDISEAKYDELDEYRSKGMPIIVAKDAVAGLANNFSIDPASNMAKLLGRLEADATSGKDNIVWNFDFDDTIKIENSGDYGTTYADKDGLKYVTVFAGLDTEDYLGNPYTAPADGTGVNAVAFKNALDNGRQRPKLIVKNAPMQYIEGNPDSWIKDHHVSFSYEAAGGTIASAKLYFDDNANSRFEEDEWVDQTDGNSGTLTNDFDADFFGVVYWKLEVENDFGAKASVTGCMKIARTDQEKIQVNLLQLIPEDACEQERDQRDESLIFCTECQQSRKNLVGNRFGGGHQGGKYSEHDMLGLSSGFNDKTSFGGITSADDAINNIKKYITQAQNSTSSVALVDMPSYNDSNIPRDFSLNVKNNLGVHEHRFGIVKYFNDLTVETKTGVDDWNTNWFTDVKDDFNVDMDVMYIEEFSDLVEDVNSRYAGMDTSEIKTLRSKYDQAAVEFKNAYTGMQKIINNDASSVTNNEKAAIQKFMCQSDTMNMGTYDSIVKKYQESGVDLEVELRRLQSNGSNLNGKALSANAVSQEVDYELSFDTYSEMPFYDFFSLCAESDANNCPDLRKYVSLYSNWRDAKIYEQFFKKMWKYYSFCAAVDDSGKANLSEYTCVLFGAAQNFAGADMKSEEANDAVIHYINDGGSTILFYDTLTSDSTVTMTKKLSKYFGMAAYTGAEESSTAAETVTTPVAEERYEGKVTIKIADPYYSTWTDKIIATYTVDTAAENVNIVLDASNNSYLNGGNASAYFTITDDETSNVDNYKKHNISINYTINNAPSWGSPGFTIWVNGQNLGTVNDASGNVKFKSSIISEEVTDGNNNNNNNNNNVSDAPLKLNPTKLTYKAALGQTSNTGSANPMPDYCIYYPTLEAMEKNHTAFDVAAHEAAGHVQTNGAEQNNEGIVTLYPFNIGKTLKVGSTIEGDFCNVVNEDSDNIIVYYSLSGGTLGTMSSNYVANPKDGGNNYFVYQYQPGGNTAGMVTYIGAGRTNITGWQRDNNDERRFFINLILNTGRKSTRKTVLKLYDHSSTQVVAKGVPGATNLTNAVILENGSSGYTTTVVEGGYPEFSYLLRSDNSVEIENVKAYYDLDYDETNPDDEYHEGDGKHILIYDRDANTTDSTLPYVGSGFLSYVDRNTCIFASDMEVNGAKPSMLELKDSYLYNNEYTYIVLKVTDKNGNVYFQRLKVILKPKLHELT